MLLQVGLTAGVYWCEYSLPEYFCEKELEIFLEIWTFNNFMVSYTRTLNFRTFEC